MATNDIWAYDVELDSEYFEKYPKDKCIKIISTKKQEGGYLVRGIGPKNIRVIWDGSTIETNPPEDDVILVPSNDNDPVEENTYFINYKYVSVSATTQCTSLKGVYLIRNDSFILVCKK